MSDPFGAPRLEPSTLPVGDATDMGYSQSKATLDIFVSTCSCAPRVYSAAPVRGRRPV